MAAITISEPATHPPVLAWVWGGQGIAYQVTQRYRKGGHYWLELATDIGPVEMPLDRVVGWAPSPPTAEVPPSPTAEATDISDLSLILLDCRNASELAAVREVYGAELVDMAWGTLTQKERQQIHTVATVADAVGNLSTAYTMFRPGDRVASLSELDPPNTTGIVTEVREMLGKTYVTVHQDDGTLAMSQSDGWRQISPPFRVGDRVRYIGKNPSLLQVTWHRDWFEVMAVVGEMVAFRHRDWWVTRECPATNLIKISEES
jgi:hypothetical protein